MRFKQFAFIVCFVVSSIAMGAKVNDLVEFGDTGDYDGLVKIYRDAGILYFQDTSDGPVTLADLISGGPAISGDVRYNNTGPKLEYYYSSAWSQANHSMLTGLDSSGVHPASSVSVEKIGSPT